MGLSAFASAGSAGFSSAMPMVGFSTIAVPNKRAMINDLANMSHLLVPRLEKFG
jgi:hypothetical protein